MPCWPKASGREPALMAIFKFSPATGQRSPRSAGDRFPHRLFIRSREMGLSWLALNAPNSCAGFEEAHPRAPQCHRADQTGDGQASFVVDPFRWRNPGGAVCGL